MDGFEDKADTPCSGNTELEFIDGSFSVVVSSYGRVEFDFVKVIWGELSFSFSSPSNSVVVPSPPNSVIVCSPSNIVVGDFDTVEFGGKYDAVEVNHAL